MRRLLATAALLLLLVSLTGMQARPDDVAAKAPEDSDRAAALNAVAISGTAQGAYAVFAETCSACHSARSERPKGDFGFILDLRRLSRAGEYVVRGQPEKSSLWTVIADGSMPPPGYEAALSDAERHAVRTWIDDGAPPGPIDPSVLPPLPAIEETSALVHWGGQWHPLVIHFPIGLLLAAALAEILFVLRRDDRYRAAAEFCLLVGTVGSCGAALSGWLFAADLGYALTTHRWLGIATSLFALATCQLAVRVRRLPPDDAPVRSYRLALAATIGLLVVTSHLGGIATWGASIFGG